MDSSAAQLLISAEGQQLLADVLARTADQPHSPDSLRLVSALRAEGRSPDLVAAVLTQVRLLRKISARWHDLPSGLLFTPDGAEQATRPLVARHRATRYRAAGVDRVVDLGCGVGMDAIALAQADLQVEAYDQDESTVMIARHNARTQGLQNLTVSVADVQQLPADAFADAAVFVDPARRTGGRRVTHPEKWSPPLSWVVGLARHTSPRADFHSANIGAKVAPGLDRELVPEGAEFEVVSVGQTVVEAGIYGGQLRTAVEGRPIQSRATLFDHAGQPTTVTDLDLGSGLDTDSVPVGPVESFLYEPDGAVIRAGLVGAVASQLSGHLLDPRIAYVTSADLVDTKLARCYRVRDVQPFNLKKLRTELHVRGIGSVTIKKRGFAMTPEELRSALRLKRNHSGHTTLVVTRIGNSPTVIEVGPIMTEQTS